MLRELAEGALRAGVRAVVASLREHGPGRARLGRLVTDALRAGFPEPWDDEVAELHWWACRLTGCPCAPPSPRDVERAIKKLHEVAERLAHAPHEMKLAGPYNRGFEDGKRATYSDVLSLLRLTLQRNAPKRAGEPSCAVCAHPWTGLPPPEGGVPEAPDDAAPDDS